MNCWSAFLRKFAWSWRIPRGLERCFEKDRERTAANRRWVRARRTTRLRNIAAVEPAPAWKCAIYSIRSGHATASRRAVRICTFCKTRRSSISFQNDRLDPEWSGVAADFHWNVLRFGAIFEYGGQWGDSRRRRGQVSTAPYSRLHGRRGGTCVSLCNEVATFPTAFLVHC